MRRQFEYQVCRVNFQRVTFVNDAWQGASIPEADRKEQDVQACPMIWDYLQRAGREGWELVSVADASYPSPKDHGTWLRGAAPVPCQLLFLKRDLGG